VFFSESPCSMHRKKFSCFSIESLIGCNVDGQQQPRSEQDVDGVDSPTAQRSAAADWTPADRMQTTSGGRTGTDRSLATTERDSLQHRSWPAVSLNCRSFTDWNRRPAASAVAAENLPPTDNPRTSPLNRHYRLGACRDLI